MLPARPCTGDFGEGFRRGNASRGFSAACSRAFSLGFPCSFRRAFPRVLVVPGSSPGKGRRRGDTGETTSHGLPGDAPATRNTRSGRALPRRHPRPGRPCAAAPERRAPSRGGARGERLPNGVPGLPGHRGKRQTGNRENALAVFSHGERPFPPEGRAHRPEGAGGFLHDPRAPCSRRGKITTARFRVAGWGSPREHAGRRNGHPTQRGRCT